MSASKRKERVLPLQMARIEALERAQKALSELRKLGLDYALVENTAPPDRPSAERALEQVRPDEDDSATVSFDQTLFGS